MRAILSMIAWFVTGATAGISTPGCIPSTEHPEPAHDTTRQHWGMYAVSGLRVNNDENGQDLFIVISKPIRLTLMDLHHPSRSISPKALAAVNSTLSRRRIPYCMMARFRTTIYKRIHARFEAVLLDAGYESVQESVYVIGSPRWQAASEAESYLRDVRLGLRSDSVLFLHDARGEYPTVGEGPLATGPNVLVIDDDTLLTHHHGGSSPP